MRLTTLLLFTLLANAAFSQLVLEHQVETTGVGGKTIKLPLKGPYSVTIDWGDGSRKESFQETSAPKSLLAINDRFISHSYSRPGIKTITITGTLTSYGSSSPDLDNSTLVRVVSWDGLGIKSFQDAFHGAVRLKSVPASLPASVINLGGMFAGAANFNGSIGSWNTSNVQSMNAMFFHARKFNQPIGNWNTSKVVDMGDLFNGAMAFNQPIGTWNTSSVQRMSGMFNMALSFNQSIEDWNTSNVSDMHGMFMDAVSFNQPIGKWNTSKVTQFYDMFSGARSFNQPIGNWNTAAATSFTRMFLGAVRFNQPISSWNTSKVINMTEMFYGARSFNQSIGNWDVSKVTKVKDMFRNAVAFNQDLGRWKLTASDKADMYYGVVNTSRIKGTFKNGRKVGKWTYHYENGSVEATGNFDDNGFPKQGSWVFYDRYGKAEPGCRQPDDNARLGFYSDIFNQTEYSGREEGEARFSFNFQRGLWDMACAFPSYNSFEVGKLKVQLMWMNNRESFYGNRIINSAALGLNIAKVDASNLTQRFMFEATRRYHLDMNFIDPADSKTLLDFIRDRINFELKHESPYEDRIYDYERAYYQLRKYLDAKHAAELKG